MSLVTLFEELIHRNALEASWGHGVHTLLMQQLTFYRPNISVQAVQNLWLQTQYYPTLKTQQLQAKRIDFALTWHPDTIDKSLIDSLLTPMYHPTINHVVGTDEMFKDHPMVVPVETKKSDGYRKEALLQLALWAMAQFNRFHQITGDDVEFSFPISLLMVIGENWTLFLAIDGAQQTKVTEFGEIGSTRELEGAYRLLEALKEIVKYVEERYMPLYRAEVLHASTRWVTFSATN